MDTTDQRKAVGVISLTPEMFRGEPLQVLRQLANLATRGRLVGWGVWQPLNELFRGAPKDFFDAVSGGQFGYVGFGDGWQAACSQHKGISWSLGVIRPNGEASTFKVWDLWEFAKRGPREGETPRRLYSAIGRTSKALGVHPRHFYGPSALSAPLMRLAGVGEHYPDQEELGVPDIARWALFSGRMQALRIGVTDEPAREYDLNSAYAWGLSQVPSLRGAKLLPLGSLDPRDWLPGWRLVRVKWEMPRSNGRPGTPLYPFPVRTRKEDGGGVEYPRRGEGWYWSPLVLEALKHWPDAIQVLEGYTVFSPCSDAPFSFLRNAYDQRKGFDRGGLEDTILKWALSCVWGKLCQKAERQWRHNSRCLLWAGMATSLVNAELLRVCMSDPRRVWHIHVDSVLMSGARRHVYNLGEGLGQWRCRSLLGIEQYRVGVWRSLTELGETVTKSQGVPAGVLDWEDAREEWETFGPLGRTEVQWNEFQGFGSCAFSDWLTEREVRLAMPLQPGRLIDLTKRDRWKDTRRKFQVWQPPDYVENPVPYDEAEDAFGLDHNPARRQERFL